MSTNQQSFFEIIGKTEIPGIAIDTTEAVLDSITKDGILKEIPILGSLINGYKSIITIKDKLFYNKVCMFLFGLEKKSAKEISAFLKEFESDQYFSQKVGDTLLLLIDRHDHKSKSFILGRLFSDYISRDFDYEKFIFLSSIIERCSVIDLKNLKRYYTDFDSVSIDVRARLHVCFLTNLSITVNDFQVNRTPPARASINYTTNDIGWYLVNKYY